jgi:hypothetical protein
MSLRKPERGQPDERATDRVTAPATARLSGPLQLWIPRLGGDLGRPEVARDAQRAYAAWDGDLQVWLSPEFRAPFRWMRGNFSEIALPAEHVDRLDVYHIGENGRAFGHCARQYFPDGRIEDLLNGWLNVGDLGGCKSVPAPQWLGLEFPEIGEQGVRYGETKISVEGGATFPTRWSGGRVEISWPPDGRAVAPTMFPDAESMALNSPIERAVDEQGLPVVIYRDGTVANQVINEWPKPIGLLMPALGSFGDLAAQQRMAAIATMSETDLDLAVHLAREGAAPFVSSGRSTWADAWVKPTLLSDGPEPILFRAETIGVPDADLNEAYEERRAGKLSNARLAEILGRSAEFRRALSEPVVVRRAWGAVGLFWALLLDELEGRRRFATCGHCGRILRGKRGKQFCGRDDNDKCYLARRAADQRRSRGRDA